MHPWNLLDLCMLNDHHVVVGPADSKFRQNEKKAASISTGLICKMSIRRRHGRRPSVSSPGGFPTWSAFGAGLRRSVYGDPADHAGRAVLKRSDTDSFKPAYGG